MLFLFNKSKKQMTARNEYIEKVSFLLGNTLTVVAVFAAAAQQIPATERLSLSMSLINLLFIHY